MKTTLTVILVLTLALTLASCSTSNPDNATSKTQKPERGPDGTIAYYVQIESSESGAKIEVNGEYVGTTPLKLKIWGDKDGTFHNFGSYHYSIRANPVRPGQQAQTKEFRTGGWFTSEDRIPQRIYFDFGPVPEAPKTETK